MNCPVCGSTLSPLSDARFAVCSADRLVVNLAYEHHRYEHDYFEKEYKNQYGRSYTEDRQAILARNQLRYEKISHLVTPESHPQVLEAGSAAGYFLKVMQEAGFSVRGWEISEAMTKYANARGIKTTKQDFLKGARAHQKQNKSPYDIVAMYYVIEHIKEQAETWQALTALVRPGGYLLLALPSASGPMFRFHRRQWYETHPIDHSVDYSPAALRRIGQNFGFTLVQCSSEGIHPARFPGGSNALLAKLYRKALEKAPLADTIFAVLRRNP